MKAWKDDLPYCFLDYIHFFLDSTNGRLSYTSSGLDFIDRIVFMKKRDNGRVLSKRYGIHSGSKKETRMVKVISTC
jgi:hypothetical protein